MFLFEAIAGLLGGGGGGGGGGGSASYSVTSTVRGGDPPVGVVSTLQGGTRPIAVDAGLDDVKVAIGGRTTPVHGIAELRTPQPVRGESDVRLTVTDTVRTDSHVDVEPMAVDLCVDVGISRLPRSHIHQPYDGRVGLTVLGAELLGLSWSGALDTLIDGLEDTPHHELGGAAHAVKTDHGHDHGHDHTGHGGPAASGGGLHIRLS